MQSREKIKAALTELLSGKEPEQISLVELCDRAGISRSTFYQHYADIHSVIAALTAEALDILRDHIVDAFVNRGSRKSLAALFDRIKREPWLSRFLASTVSGGAVADLMFEEMSELMVAFLKNAGVNGGEADAEYVVRFAVAGTMAAVREWIRGGFAVPTGRFASVVHETIINGIKGNIIS